MTDPDPWDAAARRRQANQTGDEAARILRDEAERVEREREAAARRAAQAAMEAAINQAVRELEHFLRQRGKAAQALLAAATPPGGRPAYILFGAKQGVGFYASVSLTATGLVFQRGTVGGSESKPTDSRPATAKEAVEFFARYGAGRQGPEAVTAIVSWLTRRIDESK